VNQEVKAKWVERLRDPRTMQGVGRLGFTDGRRCCLGVLCDIAVADGVIPAPVETSPDEDSWDSLLYGGDSALLPSEVQDWAGLDSNAPMVREGHLLSSLAELNDKGYSFKRIADLIEGDL
jgi:hypothetical protein